MNDQGAESHREDISLIARFLAGNSAAFEYLFRKHQRPLFMVCKRFFGNIEDAEDVLQDAFLQIYIGLPTFKGHSTFFTWAYSVTVRACLAKARTLKRAAKADQSDLQNTQQNLDLVREQVRDAVQALPDRYRMVVILQYYQELSHAEIAQVLGWTIGQVKINLHRGRNLLRESLEQWECPSESYSVESIEECGGGL